MLLLQNGRSAWATLCPTPSEPIERRSPLTSVAGVQPDCETHTVLQQVGASQLV
jgi:hypothetical protein